MWSLACCLCPLRPALRLLRAPALVLGLAALLTPLPARATTYHSLTVDGDLADFTGDEKTAGDPLGDHAFGPENDLSDLYLSWDAERLYLGLRYQAEQTAVITLIETGGSGGVSNFCPSASYSGAFPANVQGPAFNLILAFFAPADHSTAPTAYLFALTNNGSADISDAAGVALQLVETVTASGRQGALEAAIPWQLIYGLGAGQVPSGAQLRLASVLRGKSDGDGLGDASPDPSGGVSGAACGGSATVLDTFHVVTVDANSDGAPDSAWSPGPNTPSGQTDGPQPDSGPVPDSRPADLTPAADSALDRGAASDQAAAADAARRDGASGDQQLQPDRGFVRGTQEEGCACGLSSAGGDAPLLALLLLIALALSRRSSSRWQ